VPTADGAPAAVAAGSDGNAWFIESKSVSLGTQRVVRTSFYRILPSGKAAKVVPDVKVTPVSLVAGRDGAIWFLAAEQQGTTAETRAIGHITPQGQVRLLHLPQARCPERDCIPEALVQDTDQAIWFTILGHTVGRMTAGGAFSFFLPRGIRTSMGMPFSPVIGPDSNLWFGELWNGDGAYIGRMTRAGALREFMVSKRQDNTSGMAVGSDGNLWFTLSCVNAIGRITPGGRVTIYHIPGTAADAGSECPVYP
jgi:virginiamycin B lyase